jgi:hypothetical protein
MWKKIELPDENIEIQLERERVRKKLRKGLKKLAKLGLLSNNPLPIKTEQKDG